jgi:hypothetical protein
MASRAKLKAAPKAAKKNYLVLSSSCGKVDQGQYYSEHATLQQAQARAKKLMKEQADEPHYQQWEGAYVVKVLGKIVTKTTTEYEGV